MNESNIEDGRRQSILKLRTRVPLQEVPQLFTDDDTTTTLTHNRRVSFGRNLIKEFIVGSAASTQALHEYEQSSESISEPSTDCSGPLDLVLNKSCIEDVDEVFGEENLPPVITPPDAFNDSKRVVPEQRVRPLTECLGLAMSMLEDRDTVIIIGSKSASKDEDPHHAGSLTFSSSDISQWHHGGESRLRGSPKSKTAVDHQHANFVAMKHPEIFNPNHSRSFDKSQFEFLDGPLSMIGSGSSLGNDPRRAHPLRTEYAPHLTGSDMEETCINPVRPPSRIAMRSGSRSFLDALDDSDMEVTCQQPLPPNMSFDEDVTESNTLTFNGNRLVIDEDVTETNVLSMNISRDDFLSKLASQTQEKCAKPPIIPVKTTALVENVLDCNESDSSEDPFGDLNPVSDLQKELANVCEGNRSFMEQCNELSKSNRSQNTCFSADMSKTFLNTPAKVVASHYDGTIFPQDSVDMDCTAQNLSLPLNSSRGPLHFLSQGENIETEHATNLQDSVDMDCTAQNVSLLLNLSQPQGNISAANIPLNFSRPGKNIHSENMPPTLHSTDMECTGLDVSILPPTTKMASPAKCATAPFQLESRNENTVTENATPTQGSEEMDFTANDMSLTSDVHCALVATPTKVINIPPQCEGIPDEAHSQGSADLEFTNRNVSITSGVNTPIKANASLPGQKSKRTSLNCTQVSNASCLPSDMSRSLMTTPVKVVNIPPRAPSQAEKTMSKNSYEMEVTTSNAKYNWRKSLNMERERSLLEFAQGNVVNVSGLSSAPLEGVEVAEMELDKSIRNVICKEEDEDSLSIDNLSGESLEENDDRLLEACETSFERYLASTVSVDVLQNTEGANTDVGRLAKEFLLKKEVGNEEEKAVLSLVRVIENHNAINLTQMDSYKLEDNSDETGRACEVLGKASSENASLNVSGSGLNLEPCVGSANATIDHEKSHLQLAPPDEKLEIMMSKPVTNMETTGMNMSENNAVLNDSCMVNVSPGNCHEQSPMEKSSVATAGEAHGEQLGSIMSKTVTNLESTGMNMSENNAVLNDSCMVLVSRGNCHEQSPMEKSSVATAGEAHGEQLRSIMSKTVTNMETTCMNMSENNTLLNDSCMVNVSRGNCHDEQSPMEKPSVATPGEAHGEQLGSIMSKTVTNMENTGMNLSENIAALNDTCMVNISRAICHEQLPVEKPPIATAVEAHGGNENSSVESVGNTTRPELARLSDVRMVCTSLNVSAGNLGAMTECHKMNLSATQMGSRKSVTVKHTSNAAAFESTRDMSCVSETNLKSCDVTASEHSLNLNKSSVSSLCDTDKNMLAAEVVDSSMPQATSFVENMETNEPVQDSTGLKTPVHEERATMNNSRFIATQHAGMALEGLMPSQDYENFNTQVGSKGCAPAMLNRSTPEGINVGNSLNPPTYDPAGEEKSPDRHSKTFTEVNNSSICSSDANKAENEDGNKTNRSTTCQVTETSADKEDNKMPEPEPSKPSLAIVQATRETLQINQWNDSVGKRMHSDSPIPGKLDQKKARISQSPRPVNMLLTDEKNSSKSSIGSSDVNTAESEDGSKNNLITNCQLKDTNDDKRGGKVPEPEPSKQRHETVQATRETLQINQWNDSVGKRMHSDSPIPGKLEQKKARISQSPRPVNMLLNDERNGSKNVLPSMAGEENYENGQPLIIRDGRCISSAVPNTSLNDEQVLDKSRERDGVEMMTNEKVVGQSCDCEKTQQGESLQIDSPCPPNAEHSAVLENRSPMLNAEKFSEPEELLANIDRLSLSTKTNEKPVDLQKQPLNSNHESFEDNGTQNGMIDSMTVHTLTRVCAASTPFRRLFTGDDKIETTQGDICQRTYQCDRAGNDVENIDDKTYRVSNVGVGKTNKGEETYTLKSESTAKRMHSDSPICGKEMEKKTRLSSAPKLARVEALCGDEQLESPLNVREQEAWEKPLSDTFVNGAENALDVSITLNNISLAMADSHEGEWQTPSLPIAVRRTFEVEKSLNLAKSMTVFMEKPQSPEDLPRCSPMFAAESVHNVSQPLYNVFAHEPVLSIDVPSPPRLIEWPVVVETPQVSREPIAVLVRQTSDNEVQPSSSSQKAELSVNRSRHILPKPMLTETPTDVKVHEQLLMWSKEPSCLWRLENFHVNGADGEIQVQFPLLQELFLLTIVFSKERENCLISVIQVGRIIPEKFQYPKEKVVTAFGFEAFKNFVKSEEHKMRSNFEELPYCMIYFNSFCRKLSSLLQQALQVLKGYAGSRLINNGLRFRIISYPYDIICIIIINLADVLILGRPKLIFEHDRGFLNEDDINEVLQNSWQGETPILSFIRDVVAYVVAKERQVNFITKRPPLLF